MKVKSEAYLRYHIKRRTISKKDRKAIVNGDSVLPIFKTILINNIESDLQLFKCIFKVGSEYYSMLYTRAIKSKTVIRIKYPRFCNSEEIARHIC